MPPKSARYQFSWETPEANTVRVNSRAVPGGKKTKTGKGLFQTIGNVADTVLPFVALGKKKKGGADLNQVPYPHQVEISGGSSLNTGRGEVIDTEEAIKPLMAGKTKKTKGLPKKNLKNIAKILGLGKGDIEDIEEIDENVGAGLFGDIGKGLDAVTGVLGLGKKKEKKLTKAQQKILIQSMKDLNIDPKNVGGIQGSSLPPTLTNAYQQNISENQAGKKKVGKGPLSNIGNDLASAVTSTVGDALSGVISDAIGLGKKKKKNEVKGKGLFGDIGTAIDSVGSAIGLGKKKRKASDWVQFVKAFHEKRGGAYKDAMKEAKYHYDKLKAQGCKFC